MSVPPLPDEHLTKVIDVMPTRASSISVADELIRRATTPEQALIAARVRAELLRQDREQMDYRLKIWRAERSSVRLARRDYFDALLQITSLSIGTFLIMSSHEWIGGFVAAAGIYRIAKEFVLKKFPGTTDGRHD